MDYGEPTYSEFQVQLLAAVQCLCIVNDWKNGHITTDQARARLLDWDDPEHKHDPDRLEFWANDNPSDEDAAP